MLLYNLCFYHSATTSVQSMNIVLDNRMPWPIQLYVSRGIFAMYYLKGTVVPLVRLNLQHIWWLEQKFWFPWKLFILLIGAWMRQAGKKTWYALVARHLRALSFTSPKTPSRMTLEERNVPSWRTWSWFDFNYAVPVCRSDTRVNMICYI